MRSIYFIIVISAVQVLTFENTAHAQEPCSLIISGKVKDDSNKVLPGATIFILDHNRGEVSDLDGRFSFINLCAGEYLLEVKFIGYITQQITVQLNQSRMIEITLVTEEKLLSEIIVSDHPEPVSKTTNFGSLSGKSLEEVRGKSLGESLQNITGVNTIQSGPAIFKPVIHGVHSQRILILNNGVRQEGQQWGAEHAPEIDPFAASNLVVVKDAGALKYGTDALGGVIIVSPAELPVDEKIGGQFQLMGYSNGRAGVMAGLLEGGIKNHEGWGWRIQGTAKKSGDLHAPDYNLSNTGYEEVDYSTSIGYHNQGKGFEVYYSRFNTTIGILRGSVVNSTEDLALAMQLEPPQNTSSFTYSINKPQQKVSHDLLKLTGHIRKGDDLFNVQYGFQINNRLEYDLRRGTLSEMPALGYKLFTQTIDIDWERKEGTHIRSAGLNGMIQDNNKIDGTYTLPFIPNYLNYSAGIFWIEKWKQNKWNFEIGARYDIKTFNVKGFDFRNELYTAKLNFNNLSGTLAGTININSNSSFTTAIGTSWRPPNVAELYSLGTHQSAAAIEFGLLLNEITNEVNNPEDVNYKSEQALKWVSTYRIKNEKWYAEVAGYVNYIFNYVYLKPRGITRNTRGIFPYFRYTQTNASFIGLDVSLGYTITKDIMVNSNLSLLNAADVTNHDYLIFIPSNKMDVVIRYEKPAAQKRTNFYTETKLKYVFKQLRAPRVVTIQQILEAKNLGVDLFATDTRNFDFIDAPDGYFLMSLSAGFSKQLESYSKIDFRLSLDNALNNSYREYTNRMRYYADEIGRNFSLSVKYSF